MAVRPIKLEDLLSAAQSEESRRQRVAEIIEIKNRRRVEIGPWVSCVFENRATVLYQIQEMVRIERLSEKSALEHEIETFADLLPGEDELSLTMFIEISDDSLRHAALTTLGGIEKTLTLELGAERIPAFDKRPIDPRWERPGTATAVYYLGFRLSPPMRNLFTGPAGEAWLKLSHPRYRHAAALSSEQRRELAAR